MYQTLIFDLDGTLIDSAPDLHAATNHMLQTLGHPPLALDTVIGFIGNGVEMLVRRALRASGVPDTAEVAGPLARFRDHYDANLTTLTRPYAGVPKMLAELAGQGIRMGVCTNKPEAPARAICADMQLDQYMGAIVGGDTCETRKPDPGMLAHTMALLGASPQETLYIGDSAVDYATARAAQVPFAYFEGGYQRVPIPDFAPDIRLTAMPELLSVLQAG